MVQRNGDRQSSPVEVVECLEAMGRRCCRGFVHALLVGNRVIVETFKDFHRVIVPDTLTEHVLDLMFLSFTHSITIG